jgi:hypothetical protein
MSEYRTQDIVLAACLKLQGFLLITIEKNGNKGTFVFDNVPKEFIVDFSLGKLTVEPVNFHNTLKQLATSVRRV